MYLSELETRFSFIDVIPIHAGRAALTAKLSSDGSTRPNFVKSGG